MIETRDLWVRFGPVAAVRGLSLRAEGGGWTALIGPNGAGKTSALRALAGLAAYEGEVLIEGRDARRLGLRAVARLAAFVPQKPETPPALTVAEYVLLGRTPHIAYLGGEGRRDREAATEALRRLELEHFAERPLGSLSGGELQRAVLARALAQEAPVLPRLPNAERGPLRVGEHRHPARVHHLERLAQNAAARLARLRRRLVGVLDPDVGIPDRLRRRSLRLR